MIDAGLARGTINQNTGRIRRLFRWAAGEKLIPASVRQTLVVVEGLRAGRTIARETDPIRPVDDAKVDATLPRLPEVVADMVKLERFTGMRPAEVCMLRPCDVDRSGPVWLFTPTTHKTQHHGQRRTICIGPRGQEILLRYLARDAGSYCVRPSDSEPLHLAITTAGFDRHSICWEQHDYAQKVFDGTVEDPACLAHVAAADPEDDWTDPTVWRKANPSFGVTIDAEQFGEDCREAQESPAKENSFRRYRLNQWTEQDVRWLNLEKWDACSAVLADLQGRECFGGLDLSSTTDLSALVLVFRSDKHWDVLPFFFCARRWRAATRAARPGALRPVDPRRFH